MLLAVLCKRLNSHMRSNFKHLYHLNAHERQQTQIYTFIITKINSALQGLGIDITQWTKKGYCRDQVFLVLLMTHMKRNIVCMACCFWYRETWLDRANKSIDQMMNCETDSYLRHGIDTPCVVWVTIIYLQSEFDCAYEKLWQRNVTITTKQCYIMEICVVWYCVLCKQRQSRVFNIFDLHHALWSTLSQLVIFLSYLYR